MLLGASGTSDETDAVVALIANDCGAVVTSDPDDIKLLLRELQEISDTVGHKSTHVTETVYRHVIVPAIRGGASVMDNVFGNRDSDADDADEQPGKIASA